MFTESLMALSGLGFRLKPVKQHQHNPTTEQTSEKPVIIQDYERIKNLDWYEMEFNPHPSNVFRIWNITVALWLKRYVRDRCVFYKDLNPSENLKNISYVVTFLISAFWHGFYPSYYIMFSHFPFMVMLYDNYSKINKIYRVDLKIPKLLLNFIH